jgi:hypothetical protein
LNNPLFSTIYNWQHWSIWQAGSEHDNYLQWAILERQLCLCSLIFAAFWKINHALNYINHLFPSYDIIIDFWLYDYRYYNKVEPWSMPLGCLLCRSNLLCQCRNLILTNCNRWRNMSSILSIEAFNLVKELDECFSKTLQSCDPPFEGVWKCIYSIDSFGNKAESFLCFNLSSD